MYGMDFFIESFSENIILISNWGLNNDKKPFLTIQSIFSISLQHKSPDFFLPLQKKNMQVDYADNTFWFEPESQFIGKEVDIFYVYPTVNSTPLKNKKNVHSYTDIWKEGIRKTAMKNQNYNKMVYAAGDFNFFAPFYRQMTTKVFEMSRTQMNKRAKLSINDIRDAFQYYMKHLNGGRRFILLGHSQGSYMLLELLKYGMTEEQHQQMVAAYLIGYQITQNELDKYPVRLKPACGELDLHSVISFNSVVSLDAVSPLFEKTAVCINPLNWKCDGSVADASLHKGIVRFNKKKGGYETTPHYTSAHIQNHMLVCPDVDPHVCFIEEIKRPFPLGNLHFADSWLFAENIKENMRKRAGLL